MTSGSPGAGPQAAVEAALRFPGAVEQDHHGFPSFRVANRIFATLPTPELLRVFVDEHSIRAAVAAHPDSCVPVMWGTKLSAVGFDLRVAPAELIEEYLLEAWSMRATPALRAEFEARRGGAG